MLGRAAVVSLGGGMLAHLLRLALCLAVLARTAGPAGAVEDSLPPYTTVSGIGGNLSSIGSDTFNNLMARWTEGFRAFYPNVVISTEGKGSSTAPPALIEGTAQLGPMSRPMRPSEIDKFEAKYGYRPTSIPVGIDALAVYVHKDNPLRELTLAQVDGIFSSTYKWGGVPVETWGNLGLAGRWARRPVSVYGRNSASGTYGFFKDIALRRGDFRPTVKEQPGSSAVILGVASDLYAIGYSGIGYRTSGVRPLALAGRDGVYYEPTAANCHSSKYPLARFLFLYINKPPGQPLDPLVREFLLYLTAREGQQVVERTGYYPLSRVMVDRIRSLFAD